VKGGNVVVTQATFQLPKYGVSYNRSSALQKLRRHKCTGNILLIMNSLVMRPPIFHQASSIRFCVNTQNKKSLELNTVLRYRRPHAGGTTLVLKCYVTAGRLVLLLR